MEVYFGMGVGVGIQLFREILWPGGTSTFVVEAKIFGEEAARNPEHDPPLANCLRMKEQTNKRKGEWSLGLPSEPLLLLEELQAIVV